MLAPLTDYKHGITLIQDSGIQLLDFALTPLLDAEFPGKFVRKTASGPLLRLQWEAESGKYQLPAVGDRRRSGAAGVQLSAAAVAAPAG